MGGNTMKVGIIGAGTLGLTLAYRLSQAGHRVVVFEANDQVGGLGTWFDYGAFVWDKFYHVILPQDVHLLGLIEELGLSSELQWKTIKTGFLWKDQLLPMSNTWEFLRFPALSLLDKIRLGAGILYASHLENTSTLEGMTASEWLSHLFGHRVYEVMWAPLLQSKFGGLRDKVPASFMWATIARYYSTRNAKSGKERMGTLTGGFKTFYEALVRSIRSHGGRILCNAPVLSILDSNHQEVILRTKKADTKFDLVINTIPTPRFQRIGQNLSDPVPLTQSPTYYLGIICVVLVLRRSLSPFYLTNLIQKGLPFTGVIEMTNVVDRHQATAGNHLIFLPRYDVPGSAWFEKHPTDIADAFVSSLCDLWPRMDRDILRAFVHRKRYFQPLWSPGCLPNGLPISNRKGNMISINAERLRQDTHNNNAIVRIAEQAIDYLTVHGIA